MGIRRPHLIVIIAIMSRSTIHHEPLPGAEPFTQQLLVKLEAMKVKRGPHYTPRTRHRNPDGSAKYTNRLFLETSPYLLQHAHNPINWYPWSDKAFETAQKHHRPVIISIGYSTCHWCHVMEEESFEDEAIANYLNAHYVMIKIDREERPDLDDLYMSAVVALSGRGGWPMTVWLTPDRKPFYGGSYFPARDGDRGAGIGFLTLAERLNDIYQNEPEKVDTTSQSLTQAIQQMQIPRIGNAVPVADVIEKAATYFRSHADMSNGGLTGAPKFPSSLPIRFFLRHYRLTGEQKSLELVTLTLNKMAAGGMYDQIGGGFHRYATDPYWQIPHFEKMLYDNALLASTYLEGYQVTGNKRYEHMTRDILQYVSREMTSPEGAFYCATDADSLSQNGHREEGIFFTWTPAEVKAVLGDDKAQAILSYYAITEKGNFEHRNIPNTPKTLAQIAKELRLSTNELQTQINQAKTLLYEKRKQRPAPLRDEKILTAWNGLMISAYAKAGLILADQDYIHQAELAAQFILDKLWINGRLHRSYKDQQAKQAAYLDDIAFFTAGLLDLYEASYNTKWLAKAIELDDVLESKYEDKQNGGFYLTSTDHEKLLVKMKPSRDGAIPSGNSVSIMNLLRLNEFTTQAAYRLRAEKALQCFSNNLTTQPGEVGEMLLALDFFLDKPKEIVIVNTSKDDKGFELLLNVFRKQFIPNRVLLVVNNKQTLQSLTELTPLVQGKIAQQGKATAYVCEQGVCELPTRQPEEFAKQLRKFTKPMKTDPQEKG